ncbi:MAG: hypothetical protein M0Q95_02060 [Porticoccaceae bacterium]|nr:hypothetical protein [Porticoccaceae bacterium]
MTEQVTASRRDSRRRKKKESNYLRHHCQRHRVQVKRRYSRERAYKKGLGKKPAISVNGFSMSGLMGGKGCQRASDSPFNDASAD